MGAAVVVSELYALGITSLGDALSMVIPLMRVMKDAHMASSISPGFSLSVCNFFNVGSDISVVGLATLSSTNILDVKGFVKSEPRLLRWLTSKNGTS
jgi:hypothetical protein